MYDNEEIEFSTLLDGITTDHEGHDASSEVLNAWRDSVREKIEDVDLSRGSKSVLEGCRRLRESIAQQPDDQAAALKGVVDLVAQAAIEEIRERTAEESEQGDVFNMSLIVRKGRLMHDLLHLMMILDHRDSQGPVNVEWVKSKHIDLFRSINLNSDGDWVFVSELLPSAYDLDVEDKYAKEFSIAECKENFEQMKLIAESMGDIAVAQILISMGAVGNTDITLLRKRIRDHLGDCESNTEFKLGFLKHIPVEALRDTEVERVVFVHLRDRVYNIMRPSSDSGVDIKMLWTITKPEIKRHFDLSLDSHKALFDKLVNYWETVVFLDCGTSMSSTVKDESGVSRPFPSLRQRVSVADIAGEFSGGRQLNAFSMGKGKSACPFLAWEHLKIQERIGDGQKMLLLCPPSVITQFEDRINNKYYKEGKAPSVGVIASKRIKKAEDIEAAMDCEIVIIADTMLGAERKYKDEINTGEEEEPAVLKVMDAIDNLNIGYVVVDEAHRFRNINSGKATALERICIPEEKSRIPFIQLLSASPTPNRIRDMFTYIKVMYPLEHREEKRLSEVDPLRLRNVLLKCLLTLDPPDEWRKEVDYIHYELSQGERALYNFLLGVRDMTVVQKLQATRQFLLNPELCEFYDLDEHSLFDKAMMYVRKDLQETNCTLIAHGSYKAGFTRPHAQGKDTWVEKTQAALGPDVKVHVIDGDVSDADRKVILNAPFDDPESKHVILCNADTIRLGISLVHIKSANMLENDMNDPDLHQFVRRFNRANNTDSTIRVYYGLGTISEVIKQFAQLKAVLAHLVQYGGGLTPKHLRELEASGVDLKNAPDMPFDDYSDAVIRIALMIMDELLSSGAYVERFMRNFNGKGETRLKEVLSKNGRSDAFAERYMRDYPFSYQGNNGRLVASVIDQLVASGELSDLEGSSYLDLYSGPMGLTSLLQGNKAQVHSMDPNRTLLEKGQELCSEQGVSIPENNIVVGGMIDLKSSHEKSSLDMIHMNLCVNIPGNVEKIATLIDVNSRLKMGGTVIMTLPYYAGTKKERMLFVKSLEKFGFEVNQELTGVASAGSGDAIFENFVIVAKKTSSVSQRPAAFPAKNLQLRLHDRSMNARDRAVRQSIYADHHEFNIEGVTGVKTVNVDRTSNEAMMRYAELRQLADALATRLSTPEAGGRISTTDIPAKFIHLGAKVQRIKVQQTTRWYLGVDQPGQKGMNVIEIKELPTA